MSNSSGQASRLRPCPPQLRQYIDLANVLPSPERLLEPMPGSPVTSNQPEWPVREDWDEYIPGLMETFPRFQTFVGLPVSNAQDDVWWSEVVSKCRFLKGIRGLLYTIARLPQGVRQIPVGQLENAFVITTDAKGNLQVELDSFLQAMNGVDGARIRECRICGQIFWAGRIDQVCCTKPCANVLRTRRWREGYPEKYKLQRAQKGAAT